MRQEYSIVLRSGKKGKVYYVRYFRDNKMIPSQWSTRTADYREAEVFAKTNRERILNKYSNRKEGRVLYNVLRNYYSKDSPYLVIDAARGRKISESSRLILHGFIVNTFVPFLPFSVLFSSPSHESFSSCDTQKNNVMGKEKFQLCIKFLLYFPFATR